MAGDGRYPHPSARWGTNPLARWGYPSLARLGIPIPIRKDGDTPVRKDGYPLLFQERWGTPSSAGWGSNRGYPNPVPTWGTPIQFHLGVPPSSPNRDTPGYHPHQLECSIPPIGLMGYQPIGTPLWPDWIPHSIRKDGDTPLSERMGVPLCQEGWGYLLLLGTPPPIRKDGVSPTSSERMGYPLLS